MDRNDQEDKEPKRKGDHGQSKQCSPKKNTTAQLSAHSCVMIKRRSHFTLQMQLL